MTERDEDEHETPDFVGLLAGELSRNQTVAAARHLEGCAVCAHKLADLVVAHAALRSSSRVGRLLDEDVEMATVHDDEPVSEFLPPLAPLHSSTPEARQDPKADEPVAATHRRRAGMLAAAAILVLVIAGSVIAVSVGSGRGPTPVASAALQPIEAPTGAWGSVSVFADGTTRSLTVETHRLPEPAPQRFYEVWLLDPATRKILGEDRP
jgi:hypothetical protein